MVQFNGWFLGIFEHGFEVFNELAAEAAFPVYDGFSNPLCDFAIFVVIDVVEVEEASIF